MKSVDTIPDTELTVTPSREAMVEIKAEVKALTCRRNLCLPKEMVIRKLNEVVRGWVGYFYYGNCSRALSGLKGFLDERGRIYLRRKHAKKSRDYKAYPYKISLWQSGIVQDTIDCTVDSGCESRCKKMIGKPYSGAKLDRRETN